MHLLSMTQANRIGQPVHMVYYKLRHYWGSISINSLHKERKERELSKNKSNKLDEIHMKSLQFEGLLDSL